MESDVAALDGEGPRRPTLLGSSAAGGRGGILLFHDREREEFCRITGGGVA